MKLLTNKSYNSIFVYFPGIDFPNAWTLENPAVYHYVKVNDMQRVVLSKFTFLSQAKYLLFKAQTGVNYKLYASSLNSQQYYYYNNLKVFFYDYLDYFKDDVERNEKALKQFVISSSFQQDEGFSFPYAKYILMKIVPNNEGALTKGNSVQKKFALNFNSKFLQFDYNSHWIRDWSQRVDGTTWNVSGKLNSSNSLYCLNKNVGRNFI